MLFVAVITATLHSHLNIDHLYYCLGCSFEPFATKRRAAGINLSVRIVYFIHKQLSTCLHLTKSIFLDESIQKFHKQSLIHSLPV